jgi:SIR2-like protein
MGYFEVPETMVLSESDYLDFMVRLQEKVPILPPEITIAVTTNTLLFAGYSLSDWNFRVLELSDATSTGLSFTLVVVAVIFCA